MPGTGRSAATSEWLVSRIATAQADAAKNSRGSRTAVRPDTQSLTTVRPCSFILGVGLMHKRDKTRREYDSSQLLIFGCEYRDEAATNKREFGALAREVLA